MPCEDWGRYWSDASKSQGMTKIADCHQKVARSQRTDPPSEPSERTSPGDHLISGFSPLEFWDSKFLLFWATNFVVLKTAALETNTVCDQDIWKFERTPSLLFLILIRFKGSGLLCNLIQNLGITF